jgi:hypothetical protein
MRIIPDGPGWNSEQSPTDGWGRRGRAMSAGSYYDFGKAKKIWRSRVRQRAGSPASPTGQGRTFRRPVVKVEVKKVKAPRQGRAGR